MTRTLSPITITVTPHQMADALRAEGWSVQMPADLHTATPWAPTGTADFHERRWQGTSALAATVKRARRTRAWRWSARLYGAGQYQWTRGYAPSEEEAKAKADRTLLDLLGAAREKRLAIIAPAPDPDPDDTLTLPE